VKLFSFKKSYQKKSLFIQPNAEVPLVIIVGIGKRHVIGIGEIGDKSATYEKTIPLFGNPPEPRDVAKEILRRLGVPQNEWEDILKSERTSEI
jgi:hypothetical protein